MKTTVKNPGRNRNLAIARNEAESALIAMRVMAVLAGNGYLVTVQQTAERMIKLTVSKGDETVIKTAWSPADALRSLSYDMPFLVNLGVDFKTVEIHV